MSWKFYKQSSKDAWGRNIPKGDNFTLGELHIGSILRIADSLEKMEQPFIDLLERIEYYKEFEQENKKLKKTIDGLRSYINKNKK